jgi:hypothetical protein
MARTRAPRRPLWLITNHARMGVLTLEPGSDEEVLPVFSFEEEAQTFLRLGVAETSWRARATTAGELILLLYGTWAEVKKVALDPLPITSGEMALDLLCWGREDFLRSFAGEASVSYREPDFLKSLGDNANGRRPESMLPDDVDEVPAWSRE